MSAGVPSVVVDNKPGAEGVPGVQAFLRRRPDGYTHAGGEQFG
jgi:tripartite-type tricarboxylate transporter receptor subunit TctC